jgi:hypothetical protein
MAHIATTFNKQLTDFFKLIQYQLPENTDIRDAASYVDTVRRTNPRLMIIMWKNFVTVPYGDEIKAGNIDFFLNKDYSSDLSDIAMITERDKQKIIDVINNGLREPMRQLYAVHGDDIRSRMQVLVRLSEAFTILIA